MNDLLGMNITLNDLLGMNEAMNDLLGMNKAMNDLLGMNEAKNDLLGMKHLHSRDRSIPGLLNQSNQRLPKLRSDNFRGVYKGGRATGALPPPRNNKIFGFHCGFQAPRGAESPSPGKK